jgi:hypothetical protein
MQVASTSRKDCVCMRDHYNRSKGALKCEHQLTTSLKGGAEMGSVGNFQCQRCPDCVICEMNDHFYPAVGYWRFDAAEVPVQHRMAVHTGDSRTTGRHIFACNNGNGCACSTKATTSNLSAAQMSIGCTGIQSGDCNVGYHGVACGECDRDLDYGRYGPLCVPCSAWYMTLLLVLVGVLVVCLVLFFKMKASKVTKDGVKKSRMIPIFMAYLQVTWCVGAFKLQWPAMAARFFASAGVATASQISFIDCYVPTTFYHQFLMMCCIPLAATLVPLVKHCTYRGDGMPLKKRIFCKTSVAFHGDQNGKSTKAVLFFLVVVVMSHPGVTKISLEMFNCREFEHEYRLELDTSIDCTSTEHMLFEILALAVLLGFTLGVPLMLLAYLFSRREDIERPNSDTGGKNAKNIPIEQFGFLFGGFKPSTWYWEDVVILRKVLVVAITVFLRRNVFDQTYAALFVIYAALALQFRFNPFQNRVHNFAEYLSLITTTVTLNGGIASFGGALAEHAAAADAVGYVLLFLNAATTAILLGIILYEQFAKVRQIGEKFGKKLRQKKRRRLQMAMAKRYYDKSTQSSPSQRFRKAAGAMRLAIAASNAFEVEQTKTSTEDLDEFMGLDLPPKVMQWAENILAEYDKSPDVFGKLGNLFVEAEEIYGSVLSADDLLGAESVFEAFELIQEIDMIDEAIAVCTSSGLPTTDTMGRTLPLETLKRMLIAHYSLSLVDEMEKDDILAACQEADLPGVHDGMHLRELQELLREHFISVSYNRQNKIRGCFSRCFGGRVRSEADMAAETEIDADKQRSSTKMFVNPAAANPPQAPPRPPPRVAQKNAQHEGPNFDGAKVGSVDEADHVTQRSPPDYSEKTHSMSVQSLFSLIDLDKNEKIHFSEFAEWWCAKDDATKGSKAHSNVLPELRQLFVEIAGTSDSSAMLDLTQFHTLITAIVKREWKRQKQKFINSRTGATLSATDYEANMASGQLLQDWMADNIGNYVGTI